MPYAVKLDFEGGTPLRVRQRNSTIARQTSGTVRRAVRPSPDAYPAPFHLPLLVQLDPQHLGLVVALDQQYQFLAGSVCLDCGEQLAG